MRITAVALCLMSVVCSLRAQDNVIGVLDLDAQGVSVQEAKNVTYRLCGELISSGRFTIFDRQLMEAALKEQGLQQAGCTSDICVSQAGKTIGVDRMIAGSVTNVGGRIRVRATMYHVEDGRVLRTAQAEAEDMEQTLQEACPEVAEEFISMENERMAALTPQTWKREVKVGIGIEGLHPAVSGVGHFTTDGEMRRALGLEFHLPLTTPVRSMRLYPGIQGWWGSVRKDTSDIPYTEHTLEFGIDVQARWFLMEDSRIHPMLGAGLGVTWYDRQLRKYDEGQGYEDKLKLETYGGVTLLGGAAVDITDNLKAVVGIMGRLGQPKLLKVNLGTVLALGGKSTEEES